MDRLIYPSELSDPEIRWLLSNFSQIDRSLILIADEDHPVSLIVFTDEELNRLKNIYKTSSTI